MKPIKLITAVALVSLAGCGLTACSSGAPRAPLGWHRQPANPPLQDSVKHTPGEMASAMPAAIRPISKIEKEM